MDSRMMEEEEGLGGKKGAGGAEGEVDYKTKAGTAWSHSYLNQKPWHPLSYPNQRRKWIAEQTHSQRQRRQEEVAREFAQEQEFFRQTALFSKKEKEKVEMMKAVSFMYVRPPGYNAESAKAAEIADEKKRSDQSNATQDPAAPSASATAGTGHDHKHSNVEKKKRPKDVFGRPLPTEEEFEVLKNAPRLETGMPVRIKPFGVEIRNVRCVRCGTFGHQSGDRECPLKDVIMPNEESRIKRDDPLTAIMAQTDSSEPLKWELKQKPGISPPRGGFKPDDPNQQIVADDIFDEYGGFLSGGDIPALLTNFSAGKKCNKKHSKHKIRHRRHSSSSAGPRESKRKRRAHHSTASYSPSPSFDSEADEDSRRTSRSKHKRQHNSDSSLASDTEVEIDEKSRTRRPRGKHKRNRRRSVDSLCSDSEADEEKNRRHSSKRKHRRRRDHSVSSSGDSEPTRIKNESRSRQSRKYKDKRQYADLGASDTFDSDRHRHLRKH
ncbi:uncharacterized zinc finger CCHC domain-containing protein At4g19190 [Ananas comosus]|uniref:Uncharacterized zinc finger CCHC domain-containing protein At4g19190 n=1 Tax=Ananas comosus TaxID=4615 RepID=A0A6P5G7J6_ANACO|nr:uncharacterized zinc finger CCHC domain-containing protein At4g19190 [Ananas comosus]XP_020101757.1 uncharacterized zinc finger CCHC domain-containing protein At4g19190 [Ananas comosus]XP_020101758.1 uncharacterized zinc finger CCHC domain-containing protein At4g19190 [Ananas comosus]XP_020101759.1 uncharacterized zinc finger CCHC domain-containing protein At4g19190 [Ananas comosus]